MKIAKFLIATLLLVGCTAPQTPPEISPTAGFLNPTGGVAPATETQPVASTDTSAPEQTVSPSPAATETSAPTQEPTPGEGERPDEAILILSPGSGSRLVSSLRISGEADPAFEQTLVVNVVLVDGGVIATQPVQIQADTGQRGPFEAEIPFSVSGEQPAVIQVYATSARDGGVTHLASVGVTLADSGSSDVRLAEMHPERIAILHPSPGQTLGGGMVQVTGFGMASFEQTLVVEVIDQDGNVIGMRPVTVQAPELGQPGRFQVDVPFQLSAPGPGRILVRDPSPAFDGDVHLNSVEVNLQ